MGWRRTGSHGNMGSCSHLHAAAQSCPAPHLEGHGVSDGLGAAEPAAGAAIIGVPGLVDHPAGGSPWLGLSQVVEAVGSRGVHANGEVVPKQPFHLQMGRYRVVSHEVYQSKEKCSCTSSRSGEDNQLNAGHLQRGDGDPEQPLHLQLCRCKANTAHSCNLGTEVDMFD